MKKVLKGLWTNEDGAVTVDWVVLTAAVVGLAVSAYVVIESSSKNLINAASVAVDAENDGFPKN